ncbi:MAG: TolC family protein [Deltaproteobacteria bacterium]|nr:TolC family protein [Deltaproteobacteria bacterium]
MKQLSIYFLIFFIFLNSSFPLLALENESGPVLKKEVKGKAFQKEKPTASEADSVDFLEELEDHKTISSDKLAFDLTDCVRMAVRNNPEIRGADYDVEESKWKLKEAQPRGVPSLTYEYEAAPVPTDASRAVDSFFSGEITMLNRVKVGLGVPVTTFGKLKTAQGLAKLGIEASLEKRNQKTNEIVLKIKQLYYGILLARDLRSMLQEATNKLGEEIDKRESSGVSDPVDLAKMKLTRYEVMRRLGEVNKKEELALEGLRISMGVDRAYGFDIPDRHLKPIEFELKDLTYYLEEAKRYRPESRLLDIAMRAKEDEYRLEKKKLLPNLGVGAFYELGRSATKVRNVGSTNDFDDPFNFTRAGFGLRLKGEINFMEARAKIRQKQAQFYKMSITKEHAEEGLDLEIRDAYLSVKQSQTDQENSEKALRLARQLVFLTKTNYDVGVGEKKDYADSLQSYLLMKARYYESVFNYNVAVATLISKVGYQYTF